MEFHNMDNHQNVVLLYHNQIKEINLHTKEY